MGHLGPKIAHSHNSGSAVRIVLTFCTIKGIKRDMGIALGNHISGFSEKKKKKKKLFGAIWHIVITLDLLSVSFQFCRTKGQKVHGSFISYFSRKNVIWAISSF